MDRSPQIILDLFLQRFMENSGRPANEQTQQIITDEVMKLSALLNSPDSSTEYMAAASMLDGVTAGTTKIMVGDNKVLYK